VRPKQWAPHPLLRPVAVLPRKSRQKKAFLDGLRICLAASPVANQLNLPPKTNLLVQASGAKVDLAKVGARAARATTAAVVNDVVKRAEVAAKPARVKVVMNDPLKPRPTRPAATAPKVDVDAAEANAPTDVVAKKQYPLKPPTRPWQAIPRSTPARAPIAQHAKKLMAAVDVVDVVSAATKAPPTLKCHWQKMRLPIMQMVSSSKVCPLRPTHPQWQAKAASASMSAVNDVTATAMAAIAHPAPKSPMTQTQQLSITLGRL
jgi:hypothetical protein